MVKTKRCNKCGEDKSVNKFAKRTKSKDGLQYTCSDCVRILTRKYAATRDKELKRNTRLVSTFGITTKDYDKLYEEQNGCCAICKKHQAQESRRFAVDHDHYDGYIRGLLCNNCNNLIGRAKEDVEILSAAIDYLIEHQI